MRKSFGIALLLWLLAGMIGGHRIYIKEKVSIILWYWIIAFGTFGIVPLVDLFRLKSMIDKEYYKSKLESL